ncbi:prepilin peptidase [Vibrio sp. Y2-5]|uniref:prepilin peptidase n=1 Tax=Vibrio sp. Y2-5 TaxID=2743977 RepID=UPI0016601A75|nr:A24 family peptidase [Vibrio sp. Y2-5]MBD0787522.1 prepilin peptidase [Vibrio sp. Y2-5]
MIMEVTVWSVLFLIGVFDAREQRIPNFWVLILLILGIVSSFGSPVDISERLISFSVLFVFMLLIYIVGGVAAGDVKLAAVIGYLVGWEELIFFSFAFAFSCVFIGFMYQLLKHLSSGTKYGYWGYKAVLVSVSFSSMTPMQSNATYMPLAPVMIVALAINSYFSHFS